MISEGSCDTEDWTAEKASKILQTPNIWMVVNDIKMSSSCSYLLSQCAVWMFQLSRNTLKLVASWKYKILLIITLPIHSGGGGGGNLTASELTSIFMILRLEMRSHRGKPLLS